MPWYSTLSKFHLFGVLTLDVLNLYTVLYWNIFAFTVIFQHQNDAISWNTSHGQQRVHYVINGAGSWNYKQNLLHHTKITYQMLFVNILTSAAKQSSFLWDFILISNLSFPENCMIKNNNACWHRAIACIIVDFTFVKYNLKVITMSPVYSEPCGDRWHLHIRDIVQIWINLNPTLDK